ncbi:MAG TPA: SCO family protein [Stellaceae bacterium]|jgi:protein SCO1|nr:SCO family protein [Stellaceae bacterium]
MSSKPLLVLCTAAMLLVAGIAGATWLVTTRTGASAAPVAPAAAVGGPFTLTAADGATVTDESYRGKWLLVYFGYTFCPDACPTALTNISAALQQLGPLADRVQPLFITVDPHRDTPKVMADYVKAFDHRIVGLTGSTAAIAAVTKEYGVYVAPQRSEGDDYLVDHSSFIYLMNPDGKFVATLSGAATGAQLAARLQTLLSQTS